LRASECRHVILQHRRRTKSAESRIQRVVPGILTPCEFFARPRCLTRPLRGKADMTLCNANVRFDRSDHRSYGRPQHVASLSR
jgi:hypothetical protein